MLIEDILRRSAANYSSRVALRRGSFHISFEELERSTDMVAAQLRRLIPRRMHIGLLAGNRIEYVIAYFGIAKAGGVMVPFAPSTHAQRIRCEANFCDVAYILATPDLATEKCLAEWCVPSGQFGQDWGSGGLLLFQVHNSTVEGFATHSDLQTAILLATSGTLSAPRRVALSHANVTRNMLAFVEAAGLRPSDRALITLPLTASGTNTTELLAYLQSGITASIYPHRVFSLFDYCSLVRAESATVANVTPFILKLLIQHRADVSSMISPVRKWFFASAPLGATTAVKLSQYYPGVDFCYGYGLTEASPRCTMLPASQFSERPGSAGKPLRDVLVQILDGDGVIRQYGFGEIVVKGPNVMQGYYKSPDETAKVLRDGWLYTGDIGHLDREGFLYVDGRRKNLILSRGVSICPEEIEEVILQHPAVADAVASGIPDDLSFQRVIATVAIQPGCQVSESELLSFVAGRLDSVKCPTRIRFVPSIARNEAHKVIHRFPEQQDLERNAVPTTF